mmetsp:Transcript_37426/g.149325  ORF Transcript_37426/g.149325 Transcript_37426/m.149325 type:complete len:152 (+) Transcript_37426:3144-3599(+)
MTVAGMQKNHVESGARIVGSKKSCPRIWKHSKLKRAKKELFKGVSQRDDSVVTCIFNAFQIFTGSSFHRQQTDPWACAHLQVFRGRSSFVGVPVVDSSSAHLRNERGYLLHLPEYLDRSQFSSCQRIDGLRSDTLLLTLLAKLPPVRFDET